MPVSNTLPLYEIRVQGHLDPRRFRRFENVTVCQQLDGETVLMMPIRDQPALYGMLNWLQTIGAVLLSVKRLED